jgi:outer membrane lipoprotein-sorting protein
MARRSALCGLEVFALLFSVTLARAETVDEASKLITEKMKQVKSLSAKVHSEADMSSQGYSEHRTSEGILQLVRKDGQVFLRTESRESATVNAAGQTQKSNGATLAIMDGSGYVYSYIEGDSGKNAYKTKSQVDWNANPLEGAKAAYDIELLPDETIDGAAVYVFKLTPKAGSGGEGSAIQYFRKDCGYPVKIVHFDAAGKPLMTASYTDIKLDEEISPDRFVFTPPEGVEVIDLTEAMAAQASVPASAPAQPETAPAGGPQTAPAEAAPQTAPAAPAGASTQPSQTSNKADAKKSDSKKNGAKKGDSKKSKPKPKP